MNAPDRRTADAGAGMNASALLLRLRLQLVRMNGLAPVAAALLLAMLAGTQWLALSVGDLRDERGAWRARAIAGRTAAAQAASLPAPMPPADNLDDFYAALGRRDAAERQVKILFDLAAKHGLVLAQGEYKTAYDRNARLWTYQVTLPVKGGYDAIWQFALGALRAIPFAALDDIGFRRDGIKDAQVEARLRLTLYLKDAEGAR